MEARRYIPRYTIDDYEQWEGDWELWHGVPVAMTPRPNLDHQRIVRELTRQILAELDDHPECDCELIIESEWRIHRDTVVHPDLAIACERLEGEFIDRPPTLIAEVLSPSTAHKDRTAKRDLYAEEGVGFYLIADPVARRVAALRLAGSEYAELDDAKSRFNLHDGGSIAIDPAGLWG